ncbi:TIGR00730 family Rossman fold protein [Herbivorax sp. ANBcel31]|uniref:LOG family protein n=1 Tax=Herbivorax sp. ANBcel31 TaxID=3069754 RepID=UPI0027B219B0|nr:TIGR00730 family Rossman fold protein [Herbivorax sp. ANBcel31]MDQ2086928.1 TIGR00730 family Rossman fold protein [Herbivorax sp. ANBcel31]
MNKVICVYSSSSCLIDKAYFDVAYKLGCQIAKRGDTFLFGAGMIGLMGETARAVHENNGKVVGIIPKALNISGIVYERCDELIETFDMRERKAIMDERSDAFIALPGGFGTLEELLEIITLKQLGYHNKPIVILNVNNYYDYILKQFDKIIDESFAKSECKELYFVTENVSEAIEYIDKT